MDIHLHLHHRAAAEQRPAPTLDWSALPIPVAAQILGVLPLFMVGTLAVELRADLDFSNIALGALVTVFSGTAALLSLPAGRFIERVGHRRGLVIGSILTGISLTATALFADSWWHLTAGQVLAAIGVAATMPSVQLALATCIPPERQGVAFGLNLSSIPAAILLAGIAVPLIGETAGWRWAFGGAGIAGLILSLLSAISYTHADWGVMHRIHHPVDLRVVLLASGAMFLGVWGAQTVATFSVESAAQHGHTPGSVGYVLAFTSVVSIAIRIVSGVTADRAGPIRAFTVMAVFLVLGGVGTVVLALSGSFAAVAIGAVLGLGVGWGWNGLAIYALVRLNPKAAATTAGFVMVGGFSGSALSPVVFGVVASDADFDAGWVVSTVAMLAGAALTVAARGAARRGLESGLES